LIDESYCGLGTQQLLWHTKFCCGETQMMESPTPDDVLQFVGGKFLIQGADSHWAIGEKIEQFPAEVKSRDKKNALSSL
jgi:hypothetical protein